MGYELTLRSGLVHLFNFLAISLCLVLPNTLKANPPIAPLEEVFKILEKGQKKAEAGVHYYLDFKEQFKAAVQAQKAHPEPTLDAFYDILAATLLNKNGVKTLEDALPTLQRLGPLSFENYKKLLARIADFRFEDRLLLCEIGMRNASSPEQFGNFLAEAKKLTGRRDGGTAWIIEDLWAKWRDRGGHDYDPFEGPSADNLGALPPLRSEQDLKNHIEFLGKLVESSPGPIDGDAFKSYYETLSHLGVTSPGQHLSKVWDKLDLNGLTTALSTLENNRWDSAARDKNAIQAIVTSQLARMKSSGEFQRMKPRQWATLMPVVSALTSPEFADTVWKETFQNIGKDWNAKNLIQSMNLLKSIVPERLDKEVQAYIASQIARILRLKEELQLRQTHALVDHPDQIEQLSKAIEKLELSPKQWRALIEAAEPMTSEKFGYSLWKLAFSTSNEANLRALALQFTQSKKADQAKGDAAEKIATDLFDCLSNRNVPRRFLRPGETTIPAHWTDPAVRARFLGEMAESELMSGRPTNLVVPAVIGVMNLYDMEQPGGFGNLISLPVKLMHDKAGYRTLKKHKDSLIRSALENWVADASAKAALSELESQWSDQRRVSETAASTVVPPPSICNVTLEKVAKSGVNPEAPMTRPFVLTR